MSKHVPAPRTLLAAVALAAACADDATSPDVARDAARDARLGEAATRGTTEGAASADSTRPTPLPASVRVHGRLLVTTWTVGRTAADTLTGFGPLAGVRITLYRNVLVDGKGVSQHVAERTTAADGAFDFESVPGGYYVLATNVTPQRIYGESHFYVAGTAPDVPVTLRVWRSAARPDSTGGP